MFQQSEDGSRHSTSWLCGRPANALLYVHSDTLCPAGFPEVHRGEAQALCPLLSDPGAPHQLSEAECRCGAWGQHSGPSAFPSSQHETQGKCGCRSQRQPAPPPSSWGLQPDLSHQEPPPAPNPPAPAKPHMANRTPSRPHLEQFTCIQLSTSEQQPLLPPSFSIHLPSLPLSQASSIKDAIFRASNRNEAWCSCFRIQTDSSGGQTVLLVQSFCLDWPYFSSIRFSHYLFLNSSPSLLPAPCTWVSLTFSLSIFTAINSSSYVFLW